MPPPALLQGLEDQGPASEVDVLGRERQRLGDPAAGGVEHTAEGAHRPGRLRGGGKERSALLGGQVAAGRERFSLCRTIWSLSYE